MFQHITANISIGMRWTFDVDVTVFINDFLTGFQCWSVGFRHRYRVEKIRLFSNIKIMPSIPCAEEIKCACAESSPFRNLSSEAPDLPTFTGINFINLPPPLGTSWSATGCRTVCQSTESQQAADLCAADQAFQCAITTWGSPVNGFTGPSQPPVPPPQSPQGGFRYFPYQNEAQIGMASCGDGSTFTYTQPAGTFGGFSLLQANTAALTYANRQAELRKICLSDITTPVCLGDELTQRIQATGVGLAVYPQTDNWELVAGALPPGLTFNGGMITGGIASITGTPTAPGSYAFTIEVTDPAGESITKNYVMVVAGITNTDLLPEGKVGDDYDFQLLASGFTNPVFTLAAGSPDLPDGLDMDETGHITGTPETEQTVTVNFQVIDGDTGFTCTDEGTIEVTVGINWNDLASPTYNSDDDGGRGTVFGNQVGNFLEADCTHTTAGNFNSVAFITVTPNMPYSGTADVNCNAHVVVTGTNLGTSNIGGYFCTTNLSVDSDMFGNLLAQTIQAPGTYDFPFVVPAGAGQSLTVGIAAQAVRATGPLATAAHIELTLTPAS